jgi:hypothetical protein
VPQVHRDQFGNRGFILDQQHRRGVSHLIACSTWAKLLWRLKVKGVKSARIPLMGVKKKFQTSQRGRMLPFCNRWLKWAFIEAAWVSVGCSDYFGTFYKRHRARGKGANEAITITARRLAKIAWKLLAEERDYAKVPPKPKPLSPAALNKD